MTDKERQALDVIIALSRGDVSPSLEEIGAALGISKTAAHRAIHKLMRLGYVEKTPGAARSIRVIRSNGLDAHVSALIAQYGAGPVREAVARYA